MKKLRFLLALYSAKAILVTMRFLGRNASHFPGEVAIKICPDFLKQLKKPETLIAVTGTNGKTTVSNLLTSILKINGYKVTNNGFGSNIREGVATTLLEYTNLACKPKNKLAVLEVDERSSVHIFPYMKPDYLVCNNIMRDSLKRNAHTEFITFIVNKALPAETKVILNADDIICSSLGPDNKDRIYFGLDIEKPEGNVKQHVKDMVYCPKCGGKLEADYIRYNHIGRMHCSSCDFASPQPDYLVTGIDRENETFTVSHGGKEETYHLINDNIVNVYNFCGAVAVLTELGLSSEEISKGLAEAKIVKTRYDRLKSGNMNITMQLSKGQNPIACTRCFSYAAGCPGDEKQVIIIIDDKEDNSGNSESVCWLYECDYSYLNDPSIKRIIFAGPRCKDHYLRAQMAGVNSDIIKITDSFTGGVDLLDPDYLDDIYVLYDPYIIKEAMEVKEQLIELGKRSV